MRANGLKVAKGWSEAYYTEFTRNGGAPLVVSYATSPAAEVFYSKEKITEPPTGSLTLKGGVFRQVEGVALVKGGQQREAALKFIEFMRSRRRCRRPADQHVDVPGKPARHGRCDAPCRRAPGIRQPAGADHRRQRCQTGSPAGPRWC
jgi:ABC-type thiamine transport system substrate-binding protein